MVEERSQHDCKELWVFYCILFYSILDGWRDPNMIVKNFWYSILFYSIWLRRDPNTIVKNFGCSILF